MSYTELRKLYYANPEQYKQEYQIRQNPLFSRKLDFSIGDKPSFFVLCNDVNELTNRIFYLDKEIYKLCLVLPGKAMGQYSRKCLIDEIVITNNIEGVRSSRKEVGAALLTLEEQSRKSGKALRFAGMVNKYLRLLSGESISLKSCRDIRDIYDELVLDEVKAENPKNVPDGEIFRKGAASIYSETEKVIHSGAFPEQLIIEMMNKALSFLQDESFNALHRICIFHYMFEYIHPFYDGNGRLGRFLLSYSISRILTPLLSFRISETIKEYVRDYYNAFAVCNDRHNLADVTPFLITMLKMIEKSANELLASLERKRVSWGRYEEVAQSFPAQYPKMQQLYSVLIQAALFSERGISRSELRQFMAASDSTINKYLKAVDEQEMLIVVKEGRSKYYRINISKMDDLFFNGSSRLNQDAPDKDLFLVETKKFPMMIGVQADEASSRHQK